MYMNIVIIKHMKVIIYVLFYICKCVFFLCIYIYIYIYHKHNKKVPLHAQVMFSGRRRAQRRHLLRVCLLRGCLLEMSAGGDGILQPLVVHLRGSIRRQFHEGGSQCLCPIQEKRMVKYII
jgi:hypothetical protein